MTTTTSPAATAKPLLRWEPQGNQGAEFAYSGDIIVGMVGRLDAAPDRWWWKATSAVDMRYVAKGRGEVSRRATAKRAVSRAWEKWLLAAGLLGG